MRIFGRVLLAWAALGAAGWAQVQPASAASPSSGSFLGIWVWELDAPRARELKLPEEARVQVTLVRPGSPADAAGIKPGDVVAEYNGQRVEGLEQFSRLVRETPAGRPVKLRVLRNGSDMLLTARVGAMSPAERSAAPPRAAAPAPPEFADVPRSLMTWRNAALGVDVESLFGQLATYFGVTEGVLVRSVAPGSVAERAGLKAGDVIIRVGKSTVSTPAELTARLRGSEAAAIRLAVVRDRSEMALPVTLE